MRGDGTGPSNNPPHILFMSTQWSHCSNGMFSLGLFYLFLTYFHYMYFPYSSILWFHHPFESYSLISDLGLTFQDWDMVLHQWSTFSELHEVASLSNSSLGFGILPKLNLLLPYQEIWILIWNRLLLTFGTFPFLTQRVSGMSKTLATYIQKLKL